MHYKKCIRDSMTFSKKSGTLILWQVFIFLFKDLIKRFLSKLKSPIIPYKIFDSLMQTQPIGTGFVA